MRVEKAGRRSGGFTLIEVLIVLAVLAVLAGIAVPNYFRTVEKAKSSEAVASLKTVHMGEKVFRIENGVFFGPSSDLAEINSKLNIELEPQNFSIGIDSASESAYLAKATQIGGSAQCFQITETGKIDPCP